MNASEVMLHDWVYSALEDRNIQLIETDIHNLLLGYNDGIEPIPLTKEILEKNGIIEYKGFVSGSLIISYDYWKKTGFRFGIVRLGESQLKFRPKYIHEIQHALRLLKFDEMANNFKVD